MSLQALIDQYGYLAILIGTFLEGETILVLGGVAANLGYLELSGVIGAAFAGTLTGDQLYFFIGRLKGKGFLARRPAWQCRVERIYNLLERHRILVITGFRFLYGLRIVTPFALGMTRIPTPQFALFNVLGAAIWAVSIGALGFAFGRGVELVLGDIKHYETVFLLLIAAGGILLWLMHHIRRKKRTAAIQEPRA